MPRRPRSCTPLPFCGHTNVRRLQAKSAANLALSPYRLNKFPTGVGESGNPASGGDGSLLANPSALPLRQATPDAELFALLNRELETFGLHLTGIADCLGLASRSSSFRKEQIRIRSPAIGVVLPSKIIDRQCIYQTAVHKCTPLLQMCNYRHVIRLRARCQDRIPHSGGPTSCQQPATSGQRPATKQQAPSTNQQAASSKRQAPSAE